MWIKILGTKRLDLVCKGARRAISLMEEKTEGEKRLLTKEARRDRDFVFILFSLLFFSGGQLVKCNLNWEMRYHW
jgi:hypothetical protein